MRRKCPNQMSLLTRYFKMPLMRILGRNFYKYYKKLAKSQYYSLEKLQEIQFNKFKEILEIAYNNVDFYNNLYKEKGIKFSDISSLKDISKLPIITKKELKKIPLDNITNRLVKKDKIIKNSTSGSTGKPFVFALNWGKKDKIEALKIRNFEYTGYAYGRKYFSLWGFTPADNYKSKLFKRFILKRQLLDSINLNKVNKEIYSRILMKNQNNYLEGYASGLVILAKYMISKGYKTNLCGILSSAESLIPKHREYLQEAFGKKIYNRYGTREFGDIAIECMKHTGLHINMESFIVEIVNENGKLCKPGEMGLIVVTDLDNKVMPFIRYHLEDYASIMLEKCTCGRFSTLLSPPEGRIVDTIVTPSGKHLSFGFFVLMFEDYPIIDQFQVVQVDKKNIELKIIKNENFSEKVFISLLRKVEKYCEPMRVKVNYVLEIPLEKSGKMRIVKGLYGLE